MILIEDVSLFISEISLMVIMILIAKYLFCEKCFRNKRSWVVFGGLYIITELVIWFVKIDEKEVFMFLISLVFFSVMIAITRVKKRIRGIFLIWPIIGIIMSIFMIPTMIISIVTGKPVDTLSGNMILFETIYEILVYCGIFILFKKKFTFSRTEIGIWERRILNGNGVLLLVIYLLSVSIPKNLSQYEEYLLSGGVIIAIMIIGTSIIMTIKSASANNKNATIEVLIEGSMIGVDQIAPIDICTIFANALDNALEAVHKLSLNKVTIEISVKRINRIMLITFTNPCDENCLLETKKLKTGKKDYINHGFGIENIRIAADKYNGSVAYSIIEKNSQKLFSLEVMVIV